MPVQAALKRIHCPNVFSGKTKIWLRRDREGVCARNIRNVLLALRRKKPSHTSPLVKPSAPKNGKNLGYPLKRRHFQLGVSDSSTLETRLAKHEGRDRSIQHPIADSPTAQAWHPRVMRVSTPSKPVRKLGKSPIPTKISQWTSRQYQTPRNYGLRRGFTQFCGHFRGYLVVGGWDVSKFGTVNHGWSTIGVTPAIQQPRGWLSRDWYRTRLYPRLEMNHVPTEVAACVNVFSHGGRVSTTHPLVCGWCRTFDPAIDFFDHPCYSLMAETS